jgi:nucleotidyltransferase substrate binding protein (TIGR01987 family)
MEQDTRWQQRFFSFLKGFNKLKQAADYMGNSIIDKETLAETEVLVLNQILKDGLIQRFEYTHELAWKVMKDYAEYQGNPNALGSKDAVREAFQLQLISDGHIWMDMISSRNKTSHTYNASTANEIYSKIMNDYFPAFVEFKQVMEEKNSGQQQNLF